MKIYHHGPSFQKPTYKKSISLSLFATQTHTTPPSLSLPHVFFFLTNLSAILLPQRRLCDGQIAAGPSPPRHPPTSLGTLSNSSTIEALTLKSRVQISDFLPLEKSDQFRRHLLPQLAVLQRCFQSPQRLALSSSSRSKGCCSSPVSGSLS